MARTQNDYPLIRVDEFRDAIIQNSLVYHGRGRRFTDYQPDWVSATRRFRQIIESDARHENIMILVHATLVVLHVAFIVLSHT